MSRSVVRPCVCICPVGRQTTGLHANPRRTRLNTDLFSYKLLQPATSVQLHRESIKNKTLNSCPQLHQIITDFHNSFSYRLNGKFTTNSYLNIPPHLKYVATLPCQKTGANLKYVFVINDKSQDSIAKHLSCDGLLYYI